MYICFGSNKGLKSTVNQENNSLNNGHLKYVNSPFKLIWIDLKVSSFEVLETS